MTLLRRHGTSLKITDKKNNIADDITDIPTDINLVNAK